MDELKRAFLQAAKAVKARTDEFSQIDAETGDGDHGVTMAKICDAIVEVSGEQPGADTIGGYFDDLSMAIMQINGGSAGSLWAMMVEGIGEAAGDATEVDAVNLKEMFRGALTGIQTVSTAKQGEKTMLDALIPAMQAAQDTDGSVKEILSAAAKAAKEGAEQTRDMVAKFGRAKNLLEQSMGHLDAGAVSMAAMIEALYQNVN